MINKSSPVEVALRQSSAEGYDLKIGKCKVSVRKQQWCRVVKYNCSNKSISDKTIGSCQPLGIRLFAQLDPVSFLYFAASTSAPFRAGVSGRSSVELGQQSCSDERFILPLNASAWSGVIDSGCESDTLSKRLSKCSRMTV